MKVEPAQMSKLLSDPLSYPFDIPRCSYALADGQTRYADRHLRMEKNQLQFSSILSALSSVIPPRSKIVRPVGLLTCGSNASPTRLSGKLATETVREAIAIRLELAGWVPVYAATVTMYGAIPATFEWLPGCPAEPFLVVTDMANLTSIIASERGNYDVYRVTAASTGLGCDFPVVSFVSHYGSLQIHGELALLKEFQPEETPAQSCDQRNVLQIALRLLGFDLTLEQFRFRVQSDRRFFEDIRGAVRTRLGKISNVPGWIRVQDHELSRIQSYYN